MDRGSFIDQMQRLWGYYGKQPTPVALEEWWRDLQRVPEHIGHEAVNRWLRYNKTAPTLGEYMRTVGDLQPNKKFREEGARFREPSEPERLFGAEMMPILGRMFAALTRARKAGNDEKCREIWGAYVLHMYGVACKHKVVHMIPWGELDGLNGFKIPASWVRGDGDHRYTSEPEEGE